MAKKINEALVASLARLEITEQRVVALQYAFEGISRDRYGEDFRKQFSLLWTILYSEVNDAYRDVLLFSGLSHTPEARQAKALATRRFVKEGMSIMGYLDMSGRSPGKWLSVDDEAFRAELDEGLRELGAKEEADRNKLFILSQRVSEFSLAFQSLRLALTGAEDLVSLKAELQEILDRTEKQTT